MEIFQGTISSEYKCRPFVKNGVPVGLLFYKNGSDALLAILCTLGTCSCFFIWYKFNFGAFIVTAVIVITAFFAFVMKGRGDNEKGGIKYYLKDISEVKVLDNDTMTSFSKSGTSTLAGAAVGGVLLGGAGAIVGSIASGNKQLKEQIVRIGVKFSDANWVVLQMQIDETMMGQVNKSNLKTLLDMTSSKQLAPF
jgi:hypothetical protein